MSAPFPADHQSVCAFCADRVTVGDYITRTVHGWTHAECADADQSLRAPDSGHASRNAFRNAVTGGDG